VPREQKAAPFRVLAEAKISIEDFELITDSPAKGMPSGMEAHS
jgi:hypothetical protein